MSRKVRLSVPKKKQRKYYSGKKKRHTIKTQIFADAETQEIICTAQAEGAVHDFKVFKLSIRAILWGILLLADSGYQGLLSLHKNSRIPHKKSKNHPLTTEQKTLNRALSKERIVIENINARIKTFKIMSERYYKACQIGFDNFTEVKTRQ